MFAFQRVHKKELDRVAEINIIELDQKWTECTICGKDTPLGFSIPMYEDKKVDTTKTDELAWQPVRENSGFDYRRTSPEKIGESELYEAHN